MNDEPSTSIPRLRAAIARQEQSGGCARCLQMAKAELARRERWERQLWAAEVTA
jgi:hypothetical protein